jgi:2-dehydro-3-deoxyglucarate aldolase/4-hydroxy-2-oxoheptanedioate aldolase
MELYIESKVSWQALFSIFFHRATAKGDPGRNSSEIPSGSGRGGTGMGMRMKEALAQGKLVRVLGLGQLCSPKLVEMVGLHGGHHAVWLDQEHAALSIAQIEEASRAARAVGLDSFVRLAPTDYATVMRPLEAGTDGIMAAQVRSAAQAEEVVQWSKFQPRGMSGINGSGADAR